MIKIYKVGKISSPIWISEGLLKWEKLNLGRKNQNWMFTDLNGIFQGLIEFIEGLVARKISFEFNFDFNRKK